MNNDNKLELGFSLHVFYTIRLGLVNHTTDGHTFQKEQKDILIIIALGKFCRSWYLYMVDHRSIFYFNPTKPAHLFISCTLGLSAFQCLNCGISSAFSCRVAMLAKSGIFKDRHTPFHVQLQVY